MVDDWEEKFNKLEQDFVDFWTTERLQGFCIGNIFSIVSIYLIMEIWIL